MRLQVMGDSDMSEGHGQLKSLLPQLVTETVLQYGNCLSSIRFRKLDQHRWYLEAHSGANLQDSRPRRRGLVMPLVVA